MTLRFFGTFRYIVGLSLLSLPAAAAPIAVCNSSFTLCGIPENVLVQFPSAAIAGDVVLNDPVTGSVSDVFRIFNNFIDTGGGTGLGTTAFLYSSDDTTLPSPATYSANVKFITESASGITSYVSNGTTYLLGVPEPGTFPFIVLTLAGAAIWMRSRQIGNKRKRSIGLSTRSGIMIAVIALACTVASAQDDIPMIDPLPSSSGTYGNMVGLGPAQSIEAVSTAISPGLAFFTAGYNSLGTSLQLPFNIVGTDPANGPATTIIRTVLVPIKVVYQTAALSLDGTTTVPAVQNSPIFQMADYTVGGTDLGVTQYGDAVQRAEFWNVPGFSQNYHVLLGTPTVAPTVTITITSSTQGNLYRVTSTGQLVGVVRNSFFDSQLNALVANYSADTLPIFLTDNVFEGSDGTVNTCCIIGYHSSQGPPASTAKTWIYAAYAEPSTFGTAILDVQALSHEVAEWMNDPFVGAFAFGFLNIIPPAILPGTGGACIVNFETGDPLESPPAVFTKVINATTFHLQDEVFLPWYLHTVPSFSVNGWYTMQNTFTTFSSLCGPG
jgi:hypothetical protein